MFTVYSLFQVLQGWCSKLEKATRKVDMFCNTLPLNRCEISILVYIECNYIFIFILKRQNAYLLSKILLDSSNSSQNLSILVPNFESLYKCQIYVVINMLLEKSVLYIFLGHKADLLNTKLSLNFLFKSALYPNFLLLIKSDRILIF